MRTVTVTSTSLCLQQSEQLHRCNSASRYHYTTVYVVQNTANDFPILFFEGADHIRTVLHESALSFFWAWTICIPAPCQRCSSLLETGKTGTTGTSRTPCSECPGAPDTRGVSVPCHTAAAPSPSHGGSGDSTTQPCWGAGTLPRTRFHGGRFLFSLK